MSQLALLPEVLVQVPDGTSDEWFTPRKHFQLWDEEFGFDLDVCATAESAKCQRFFTREQNGLEQSWGGARAWCNPPYSNIALWVEKAHWEVRDGCELVVMLLPSTKTEQPWWQRYIENYRDRGLKNLLELFSLHGASPGGARAPCPRPRRCRRA